MLPKVPNLGLTFVYMTHETGEKPRSRYIYMYIDDEGDRDKRSKLREYGGGERSFNKGDRGRVGVRFYLS